MLQYPWLLYIYRSKDSGCRIPLPTVVAVYPTGYIPRVSVDVLHALHDCASGISPVTSFSGVMQILRVVSTVFWISLTEIFERIREALCCNVSESCLLQSPALCHLHLRNYFTHAYSFFAPSPTPSLCSEFNTALTQFFFGVSACTPTHIVSACFQLLRWVCTSAHTPCIRTVRVRSNTKLQCTA